jgi:hypothetical protein
VGTAHAFANLPLVFEPNKGQADSQVKFLSRRGRLTAFLTANGAVVALQRTKSANSGHPRSRNVDFRASTASTKPMAPTVFEMKLLGANHDAAIEGVEELTGKTNYFVGNDPKKWHSNVPNYGKVRYRGVYKGVDLYFYGHEQQLEYDFVVAPGGDPSAIRLHFAGAKKLRVDTGGDLIVRVGAEDIRFRKPLAYQPSSAVQLPSQVLDGGYVLGLENEVGFRLAPYDRTRPIVIDPVLSFATYLGGSGLDSAIGIALDSSGNSYILGNTNSPDFPVPAGGLGTGPGTYIVKVNSTATALDYATYLGPSGTGGVAIAVDASGNAYVTGAPSSANFPTTTGAFQTAQGPAYITEIDPSGSTIVYSTFFPVAVAGLAVDSHGSVYLTGGADSSLPVTSGAFQPTCFGPNGACAYLAKFNATGTALQFASYLGGSGGRPPNIHVLGPSPDIATSVAVDSSGRASVVGYVYSADFPVTTHAFQSTQKSIPNVFVAKFAADGSGLVFSTYLGGSQVFGGFGTENPGGIATDSAGNTYVTGLTGSSDFPVTPGAFQQQFATSTFSSSQDTGFVTAFDPDGSVLYSTFLGGNADTSPRALAVDSTGEAFVTGTSNSPDFPLVNSLFGPPTSGGSGSNFVTEFDKTGDQLILSTTLPTYGGAGDLSIAASSTGDIYVAGEAASGFPVTGGVFQATFGGGNYDTFIAKINAVQVPLATVSPSSLNFSTVGLGLSASQAITFSSAGSAPMTIAAITITGDFSQTNTCPLAPSTLAARTPCTITVTFEPRSTGALTGQLTVKNDARTSPQVVTLTGVGTSGTAQLSATSLTFASQHVATASAVQSVTLTNTATTTPLLISGVGQATGDFSQTNNCPSSLAAGASCSISVTFSPTVNGARTGTITITDSDASGTQVISLTGTGTGPVVALSPTSLDFGNEDLNATSAAQLISLTNSGDGPLNISSTSASSPFSQTNTCRTSVAAGASCTISVSFAPTSAGNQTGNITITDNAAGSPRTVNLTGIGIPPFSLSGGSSGTSQTVAAGQAATYALNLTPNNFSGMVTLSCSNPPPMATCSLNTTSVSLTGTASVSVTATITTTGRSGGLFGFDDRKVFRTSPRFLWVLCLIALVALYTLSSSAGRSSRPRFVLGGATLALILTAGLAACGGGSSTGGSANPPPTVTGTPAGTYTVVVGATAQGTTQNLSLQVVVQ